MTVLHKFPLAMTSVGLALMQLASLPVHAVGTSAGVQILDPSGVCASWQAGGTAAAPTLTCIAATPPVAGAPVCTLVPTPSSLPAGGGQVGLTATCTNTDINTTWTWTGGAAVATGPGVSPQAQNVSVNATTTFGVVATNTTGPSANKTATVTVGVLPPPPPPGAISCSGFDKTVVLDIPWASNTQVFTSGFGGSMAIVGRLKVPAGVTSTGTGSVSIAEFAGNAYRYATLTSDPCNFSAVPGAPLYNANGPGLTVSFNLAVGVAQPKYVTVLQAGGTYYLNLRNRKADGTNSCPVGPCDAVIEFHKPSGT